MKCSIYDNRPEICKEFPIFNNQLNFCPSCSYKFDIHGDRMGECNQCGECCFLRKDIHGEGPEFVKGAPCKYLIE